MGARPGQHVRGLSFLRLPVRLPHLPSGRVLRRRLLVAAVILTALAAAYIFWFRDSSFVQVNDVEVVGADSDQGAASVLTAAAAKMSTLHFDVGALEAAVADDPAVAAVSATPNFPHGVRITVDVRRPAGYIDSDGGAILAADGTVLATGLDQPDGLPRIAADPDTLGEKAEGPALAVATILGAAPNQLSREVDSGRVDPENGPTAALTGGLELRFGDASRADMKWRAAAAVLADPDFAGATYLDLSVPSRPVAG